MYFLLHIVDIRYVVFYPEEWTSMLTEHINYVPLQNLIPGAWRKSRKSVISQERYQPVLTLFPRPPNIFFLLPTFNEIGSQPHQFSMSLELLAVLHYCPWLNVHDCPIETDQAKLFEII